MDFLGNLKRLLGIQDAQKTTVINGRTVKPGYEDAAQKYEAAFARNDLNSPDIIGVDPANFGYPAEVAPQRANTNQILGSVNPIWQRQNRQTPYGLEVTTNLNPQLNQLLNRRR